MWRKKKVCSFFLLENYRPLSPWRPLDSLSTCLGTDSLSHVAHRGAEPALPALESEVLTTGLPGKFQGVIVFEMEFILEENYNKRKLLLMIEI